MIPIERLYTHISPASLDLLVDDDADGEADSLVLAAALEQAELEACLLCKAPVGALGDAEQTLAAAMAAEALHIRRQQHPPEELRRIAAAARATFKARARAQVLPRETTAPICTSDTLKDF
jgi:hypothetical protein